MNTCVVIPTYNESKNIGGLINQIRRQELHVVVVDDGSKDNTAEIARQEGAVVISHPVNLGKGASLIKGFSYALEKGFDAVITMDGDGQHLPEDIFFFMRVAKYSPSAIFVGNRMHKARNMPPVRLLTNKFMSWLVSFVAKQKIPDTQCGFRLIKKEVLKKVSLHTSKYETESEILIKASRHGFKIEPVMIKTIYRGEKSQINPLIDSFRFVRFILREIWAAGS